MLQKQVDDLFEFQDSLGYQRNAVLNKTNKNPNNKAHKVCKDSSVVIVQAPLPKGQVSSQNLGTLADMNAGKIKMHIKIRTPLK